MTACADWDALQATVCRCTVCPLAKTRTTVVFGAGARDAALMFVGEAPGEQEDRTGTPFVGRSGALLTRLIEGVGLTREEVYIANVVKCRPPGNRNPRPEEIAACRPFLDQQIELLDPQVVVPLGNVATRLLLATREGITKLRGRPFPYRGYSMIVPTLHPAAVLRGGAPAFARAEEDFRVIRAALDSHTGTPS